MKHSHMAVGLIPENLVNVGVLVQWTPGEPSYVVTLIDNEGKPFEDQEHEHVASEPLGYAPPIMDLDVKVYHALARVSPLVARLTQSLAGFGYFQWFSPAAMSSKARQMYAEAAK
ncbi:hypothetical protein [Streptomyces ardesiacus]|uniref:hypothetical protein n=1 Tax=Streptomyces ardesiacus TaxID=285564 RepID=UPI00380E040F